MEINVTYEDKQYKLCLKEQSYNLNLNNSNNTKLVISKEADNKINYLGNVVHFKGDKMPPNAVFINDITVTFTTGQTSLLIDLSAYAKKGVVYYPIFVGQSFVASHLLDRCIYNVNTRELTLYNDSDVTTQSATDNTLVLIPMDSDVLSVVGITNGQYNGDYSRYYSKGEVNTLLEGKQDTLTFDDTPTQSSNNPVKSGGIYTALLGKVNNTGNETIAGNKTFTGSTIFSLNVNQVYSAEEYKGFYSQCTSITKGTAPTTNTGISIASQDSTSMSGSTGRTAEVALKYKTNGSTEACLVAYKPEQSSTTTSSMGIIYPASGDPYTYAPTPAVGDDSTKIATTEYINDKFVVVNSLPATPDPDVFYFIPEV